MRQIPCLILWVFSSVKKSLTYLNRYIGSDYIVVGLAIIAYFGDIPDFSESIKNSVGILGWFEDNEVIHFNKLYNGDCCTVEIAGAIYNYIRDNSRGAKCCWAYDSLMSGFGFKIGNELVFNKSIYLKQL